MDPIVCGPRLRLVLSSLGYRLKVRTTKSSLGTPNQVDAFCNVGRTE